MQTLVNPSQVLSDENMTKVCLITDINKAGFLLTGMHIDTPAFDALYDASIEQLNALLLQVTQVINFRRHMQELAQELSKIHAQAQKRRFEEEGD